MPLWQDAECGQPLTDVSRERYKWTCCAFCEETLTAYQAIDPSIHSVSLVDMRRPDAPIIYVNRGFEKLTGYTPEEVVGRNCRFLQGRDTDRDAIAEMRRAMDAGGPHLTDVLNYKKSGEPFWNRLSLRPVRNERGEITHYVGIQSDITALRRVEDKVIAFARDLDAG
ncbi:MAG: PAS domain-containing protein [Devosia sp.]|uniref:PAS domain-containing protein n=1 Tax=Devosia sp. TaxID=1871048 RepID=UPI001A5AE03E|nr:PAS domain-containing protein [Devosia sp.]MBL8600042.1 PAS domain-containing protein [Devosia sp.]